MIDRESPKKKKVDWSEVIVGLILGVFYAAVCTALIAVGFRVVTGNWPTWLEFFVSCGVFGFVRGCLGQGYKEAKSG
jgi:hypothetical protein